MSIRLRGRGTATFFWMNKGSTAPVSLADECRFRYNTALARAELSENGGAYGPFVGAGGTMLTVTNIADLAALDEAPLTNGVMVAMLSVRDPWQLDKTATNTPNGITIIATHSGTGRWFRLPVGSRRWRKQLAWKIDQHPGVGNDENDGTPAHPLATWDEFVRRHGDVLGSGGAVSVLLDGPGGVFTGTIEVPMYIASNESLVIQGTRTVVYSGSVTAYQAWTPGLSQECQITDTAIPVSWTASGLVGDQMSLTNGAHVGAATFVALDLTGKKARTHLFFDPATFTYVEPIVTSTFNVCTLTAVSQINVASGQAGQVTLMDLNITNAYVQDSLVYFMNCKVHGVQSYAGTVIWEGGLLTNFYQGNGGTCSINSVISSGAGWVFDAGSTNSIGSPALCQTDSSFTAMPGAAFTVGSNTAFLGCTTIPFRLKQSSFVNVKALLWGTGNTGTYEILIDADGCFSCAPHVPQISGAATADASVGGTSKSFADITAGYINPTNLARAVVSL